MRRYFQVAGFCQLIAGWLLLGWSAAPGRAAGKEEFAGESAKWHRYESPHFELFSSTKDGDSRELLQNMELLRALFYDTFKFKERQPLEVTVYSFAAEKDFRAYVHERQRQSKNLAGFYLSRPDRAVIVISPSWSDASTRHLVFHEYIHHLVRVAGAEPPVWLNEALAELYSTMEVDGEWVLLGEPLPWHIASLRTRELLPLETLFAVDPLSPIYNTGRHTGQFYAEAWALLHYWTFGQSKLEREKVHVFLRGSLLESVRDDPVFRRELFRETMGMDYPAMQRALQEYVVSGRYVGRKARRPQIAGAASYERRAVPREEIRERLAELELRVNQTGRARLALLRAAEKSPENPPTHEALGTDAWAEGDVSAAQLRWDRAIAAGSQNPAVFHEQGQIEGQRWFANFDYDFRLPEERVVYLRKLLHRSIERAPEQSAAYEMLAWVEATAANPGIANVNLVQLRFKSLRHKARTLAALALVRLRLGDRATAADLLDWAELSKPDSWVTTVVAIIRAQMANAPTGEASLSAEAAGAAR